MTPSGIDLEGLKAAVAKVKGVNASVKAFIAGIGPRISAAVTAAVTKALADDDVTDQQILDAGNAGVASAVAELIAEADGMAAAIVENPETPTV